MNLPQRHISISALRKGEASWVMLRDFFTTPGNQQDVIKEKADLAGNDNTYKQTACRSLT